MMVAFAQAHAEAALRAAVEAVKIDDGAILTEDSILSSYPPENIK